MFNRMWISLVILLGLAVSRTSIASISKTDEMRILESPTAVVAKHDFLIEKLRKLHGTQKSFLEPLIPLSFLTSFILKFYL